jgi:hypothetical protein
LQPPRWLMMRSDISGEKTTASHSPSETDRETGI